MKAREYWIGIPKNPYRDRKIVYTSPTEHELKNYKEYTGSMHVIEKSAYDKAIKALNEIAHHGETIYVNGDIGFKVDSDPIKVAQKAIEELGGMKCPT